MVGEEAQKRRQGQGCNLREIEILFLLELRLSYLSFESGHLR